SRGRITAVAREGDRVPGVGRLSGFGKHPAPGLGDDGTVVFAAAISGGRAVEGIFAAQGGRVRSVALSGSAAPGVASGTVAGLDAPATRRRSAGSSRSFPSAWGSATRERSRFTVS